MFESIIFEGYWYMFVQVIVTLLLFPLFSAKRFTANANAYCERFYPEARSTVLEYKKRWYKWLTVIVIICFCAAMVLVLHAKINQVELLNWDNQAGLIVLFLIAMGPVITFTFMQKGLFSVFKTFGDGTRMASLRQAKWQTYFPITFMLVLIGGQFIFIGTVSYFATHPFDGFAGYSNLFGLVFLNVVFMVSSYAIFNSKQMACINPPQQRVTIKRKAIKLNLIIWIVAVYYLSTSMWVSGAQVDALKLITQSFYFQLIIFLSAYASLLPKPLTSSESDLT